MSTVHNDFPKEAAPRRARGRPRKTLDERDDGNRRLELLSAAARLFRQQGFAATTTRDIATAAGMRSGSPFYHFENKQALLAAVMEEGMRSALLRQNKALAQLAGGASVEAQLRVLVRNHFEVLLGADSDFIPVMLYEWRALDIAQMGEIKAVKDVYEAAWVPVFKGLHAEGRLSGEPRLARLMIFGALNWTVQWYQPPGAGTEDAREKAVRVGLDELTASALSLFLKVPT
ncbi:TetR family transcriptional regulator [Hydrogenophaga crassostreae]|uniref:TetR family transcriptional regulator n=1 Tax=Hydrogenophaga crassostreae TaxID=1763535 RepID=A0A163CDE0_9BURK|nr:TetR/AcrR family transcriptional regulator [Hydrogenophaga crassostreae]AOW14957.1 TetR family transcriptional regulator [Hydrogenophaga crassostreae]OAD41409.1 TetR family transcriptional regulator [Hydrogenophaga crassostreae]